MRRSIRSSFVFVDGDGDVDVAFNGPAAVEGAGRSSQRKVKQKSSGQKKKQTNKKTKKFPFFFSWFRVDKAENVSFRSSTDDFNETKKRITRTQNEKSKREREREREWSEPAIRVNLWPGRDCYVRSDASRADKRNAP